MGKMEGGLSWISDLDVVEYDVDELDDLDLRSISDMVPPSHKSCSFSLTV